MTSQSVDTSGLERLARELEHGAGSKAERLIEFSKQWPAEMAKFRRKSYRRIRLYPSPVDGSAKRGAELGYFATKLRDGSQGYMQRRIDDCLQAAIATVLQMPPHLVPDLKIGEQLSAGKDPDHVERDARARMARWTAHHGVTIRYHPSPPTSASRWIGVVSSSSNYSDHCLLMRGRDCLFDPCSLVPPGPKQPVTDCDPADIEYGITIEKR